MSLIIPANSASAAGGYAVDNSVRFNKADTAYMHKTTSAGNRRTWSFSTWLKRSSLGTQVTFGVVQTSTGNDNVMAMQFTSANKLEVWDYAGGITAQITTNRLFRDTSAWMHILVSADTTSGTANNRLRLYINGTEERGVGGYATDTMPSQNYDFDINQNSKVLKFGAYDGGSVGSPADFYYAETVFVDGTALSPTDVGEFDEDSGIWKPIDVSGLTFGTNGFYLDFKDSANLGNDANGGTDLTEVNLTAIDQTTDTPTNNFCTWNAIAAPYSAPTLSEGNTKVTNNAAQWQGAIGTFGVSQGKWYWEARFDTTTYTYNHGVIDESVNFSAQNPMNSAGYTGFYNYDGGEIRFNEGTTSANYGTFGTNDIIGIALNMDDKQISIYKNGASHVSNFGLSTTGQTLVFPSTTYYSGGYCSYNFGNAPYAISSGNTDGNDRGNFEYAVPSGYLSLCTANLSEVLG